MLATARHCQTGDPAKGDSTAASGVTVYWNALTPCGQTINPFMRDVRSYQTGATTVLEQQDVWLMKLDNNPVIDDAYFAGLDATGSVVVNGYTVHHGNALSKQYVEWFGQAASRSDNGSLLHVPYSTVHWGTVNQLGSVAPGASGSALFDQNNRMTGSLSLASTVLDACPASAPAAPTVTTAVAFFTQLGQLWDNTSDSSSSTGSATLKSVPQDPGIRPTLLRLSATCRVVRAPANRPRSFRGSLSMTTGGALRLPHPQAPSSNDDPRQAVSRTLARQTA